MPKEELRPLWRLLLAATNQKEGVTLSCDDCFAILEYLAEMRARVGVSIELLCMLARNHLSCCPDCHKYYLQRLEQLESLQLSAEEIVKEQP